MKPFDLEKAKAGAPIMTRDGRPAKFIAHVPEAKNPVVVLIGCYCRGYDESGESAGRAENDLFMAPVKVKHEAWLALQKDGLAYGPYYVEQTAKGSWPSSVEIRKIEWEVEQ